MQTIASLRKAAVHRREPRASSAASGEVGLPFVHKRARGAIRLPWRFNMAVVALMAVGIAVPILLQM